MTGAAPASTARAPARAVSGLPKPRRDHACRERVGDTQTWCPRSQLPQRRGAAECSNPLVLVYAGGRFVVSVGEADLEFADALAERSPEFGEP